MDNEFLKKVLFPYDKIRGYQDSMVKDVKEDTIVVDGNHPLAGKDLVFDLEVVEIK